MLDLFGVFPFEIRWVLFPVLIAGIVFMTVFALKEKNLPAQYKPVKSLPLGIATALTAGLILLRSAAEFLKAMGEHPAYRTEKSNLVLYIILSVLGVFAAAAFVVFCVCFIRGRESYVKVPFLLLAVLLWSACNLVVQFISSASTASLTENILEVFTLIALLLFLIAQTKMLLGSDEAKMVRRCLLCGFPALLLSAVSSWPICMVTLIGRDAGSSFSVYMHLANLGQSFFVLFFLSAFFAKKKKPVMQPVEEKPTQVVSYRFPPMEEILSDVVEIPKKEEPAAVKPDDRSERMKRIDAIYEELIRERDARR